MYDMDTLQKTREWAEAEFGKDSEAMKRLAPIFEWYGAHSGQQPAQDAGTWGHLDKGMQDVETVNESSERAFREKVKQLMSQGYRIAAADCGYIGNVGGNVYGCEYWMAMLVKDVPVFGGDACQRQ